MPAKIDIRHSFPWRIFTSLSQHPAIEEIENIAMDEGRFFVHLRAPWAWSCSQVSDPQRTHSFGSVREARAELKHIKEMP